MCPLTCAASEEEGAGQAPCCLPLCCLGVLCRGVSWAGSTRKGRLRLSGPSMFHVVIQDFVVVWAARPEEEWRVSETNYREGRHTLYSKAWVLGI